MEAPPQARLHLDTVIAHRPSLPLRGFYILMGLLLVVNLVVGLMFGLMGAWFAPAFMGLDILGLGLAMLLTYRRSRRAEHLQVSADQVRVIRRDGKTDRLVWTSPTAFTRVSLEGTERRLRLRMSRKALTIAAMLGVRERAGLATRIEDAIRAARNERHGD